MKRTRRAIPRTRVSPFSMNGADTEDNIKGGPGGCGCNQRKGNRYTG